MLNLESRVGLVVLLILVTACIVAPLTRMLELRLRRSAIVDIPNARSSHTVATPRGGGLVALPVVLLSWSALALIGDAPTDVLPIVAGATLVGLISWLDDVRGLGVGLRLAIQLCAVLLGLTTLTPSSLVFGGFFLGWVDYLLLGIAWLWFINLFNFMDGIDGITGAEVVSICSGLILVALVANAAGELVGLAAIMIGAACGFLYRNWHPANIFLGDVGSITFGYLIGWLLLKLAGHGLWLPAVVLPLYYIADATLTLMRRLLCGEKVWEAHREHFYQLAVRLGRRHDSVVLSILIANAALLAVALGSLALGPWALVIALLIVSGLLSHLAWRPARAF